MTRDTAIQPKPAKESRDLDPNVRQRRASSPDTSVWVNASAGTGKTKVLTDRVLRLLLPQEDGQEGTKPHRILCLTFTKAAAAEMALRINERLSKWAVMSDEDLRADLEGKLLGKPPTPQMMVAARKLFVEVLDSPGGLNIMTIHAFCQSLLGRFPIEAGLSPNFEVIDDTQSQILLDQARDGVLKQASNPEHDLNVCLQAIAQDINDSQFSELLRALCRETGQLAQMSVRYQKTTDLKSAIYEALRAPIDKTRNDILADFCTHTPDGLSTLCAALSGSGKNDHAMGSAFQSWIESDTTARQGMFDVYANALIKKDQTPRSIGKKLIEANAELPVILNTEVQRILETRDQIHALHNAALTQSLLKLGQAILSEYAQKKSALGVLDYEDLINRTLALLSGETRYKIDPSWVLFKLDGGLDHILIDEAQDTNPEQWRIISILTQEFYAGSGQSEIARTLFVVGDEKQSIYSFQRAAPLEFERMRSYFAQKIQDSGNNWRKEDMTISFRSTKSVLQLVDRVFEDELARRGLGAEILPHDAFRRGAAGHAELWPLTRAEESEKDAPWTPPITIQDVNSAQNMLANQIATQIDSWLKNEEQLESQGRAIKAGDILVLVRTRTAFVNQLVRALKSKSIPVSGVDRLALNDALSVQDLIVAAEFALLPFDDLALATLLKSPFIGLSEEELYEIAIDRDGSLWQALQASEHADIIEYCTRLIGRASYAAPYDFFAQILQEPCPAHEISGLQGVLSRLGEDALDPIEEFMTTALDEERESGISLQRFVHGFRKNRKEIKRELEEAGNAVRIMTIHGAKGLQAPIVFLPDTTRTHAAKRTPRLLWPDKTELDVPLWCPRKDIECKSYRRAFDRVEQTLDDEYRRLLYVALTRAEDRIYICGTEGKTGYLEDSWYNYVRRAFESMDDAVRNEEMGIVSLSNLQTKEPETKDQADKGIAAKEPLPKWFFKAMPQESDPPKPLVPSRPSTPEPAALSPLAASEDYRYKRGNIIHALLQTLPDIEENKREAAAQAYLQNSSHGLPDNEQKEIARETIGILNDSDFAHVFGEGSAAEVPITGLIEETTLISGQIDRLLITDDEIFIVDYKTNRPPPKDVSGVPVQYKKQLEAYARTLEKIYPNRKIRTALLWTNVPKLMEI